MAVDNKGMVSYVRVLKEDLAIFKIKPSEGSVPDFKAGQFVTIGLDVPSEGKIVRRAYSIASPPEQKNWFELVIRWVRKPVPGRLTTELFNKREGDEVLWLKPTGPFTINEKMPDGSPDNRRMVLIGGGTGLAPFIAYSLHLKAIGSKREIVVLHGASYVDELSYRELLTDLENLITGRINGTFVIELVSVDLRSGLIEVGTGRKEESSLFLDRSLELIDLL